MQKINFYHNFELFKKHINFPNSKECPQRMDIIKKAFDSANQQNLINSIRISENNLEKIDYREAVLNLHSQEHLVSVEDSPKKQTALYPIKTFINTLANSTKDGQISYYAMRPPGHHSFAGGSQKDDHIDNASYVGEGFCYFNNVAFASIYTAKNLGKKAILVVDWDYHHGNGTQNSFFDFTENEIKSRHTDFDVYFLSIHNATIYPYEEDANSIPNNFGTINAKATNSNSQLRNIHIGKNDFNKATYLPIFKKAIDEAFENITPDMIFISAGFDARKGDPVAKFVDGQGLGDSSYYEMAKYIKQKQQQTSPKTPIISLQEGGYNITDEGFSNAVVEHIKGLVE